MRYDARRKRGWCLHIQSPHSFLVCILLPTQAKYLVKKNTWQASMNTGVTGDSARTLAGCCNLWHLQTYKNLPNMCHKPLGIIITIMFPVPRKHQDAQILFKKKVILKRSGLPLLHSSAHDAKDQLPKNGSCHPGAIPICPALAAPRGSGLCECVQTSRLHTYIREI